MRPRLVGSAFVLGGVALAWTAAPGSAQELGTDCELPEFRTLESSVTARGFRIIRVQGPFLLVCPDGVRIRADSAVVYEETGRNHLMGRVRFDSPERELRSREADYFDTTRRLHARGAVEFRDLLRGTEVRGDTLVYLEATDLRPLEHLDVRGRPARGILPRDDLAEGEVDPDPYRVNARRLRFEGERFFWADDEVEVLREEMRADSDSLTFDRTLGELTLRGNARVEGEEGDFEGTTIVMILPDDVLESVTIHERGRLRTPELDLRGEEIRVTLEEERIQRIVAVHRAPAQGGEPGPRPRAVSEDFILEGDSLDARTPAEVLETVHAVGRARAETRGRTPGSRDRDAAARDELEGIPLGPGDPDEAPVGLLDRDFLEGDEILATFVPVARPPDPELPLPDPDASPEERREYRLETLQATGEARTLYRAPPDGDDEEAELEAPLEEWALSYVLADRILIFMLDGEVDRMEADGQFRMLHLEPRARNAQVRGGDPGGTP